MNEKLTTIKEIEENQRKSIKCREMLRKLGEGGYHGIQREWMVLGYRRTSLAQKQWK